MKPILWHLVRLGLLEKRRYWGYGHLSGYQVKKPNPATRHPPIRNRTALIPAEDRRGGSRTNCDAGPGRNGGWVFWMFQRDLAILQSLQHVNLFGLLIGQ